jgi:ribonucleoside-diphosphate reductase alpha chain
MENKFYWLNEDSRTFLERGYLKKGVDPIDRVRKISETAEKYTKIKGLADKIFDYSSQGFYSFASPVWANFGEERALPVSCFGSVVDDSVESILYKNSEIGMMTKVGGGTSAYLGNLRPRGAEISAGGESDGPIRFLELFDKTTSVISQGCYDNQTEVLTSEGWKLFESIHDNYNVLLAQVGEGDEISFVKPSKFFKYKVDEDLLLFKDSKNIDLLVTKNHNMVFKYEGKAKSEVARSVKNEYRFAKAVECPLHRDVKFAHSSFGSGVNKLTDEEKFLIALQADGSITKNTKTAYKFRFKKQRKIDRLTDILDSCGYHYTKNVDKHNVTCFYVNTYKEFSKKLNWVDLQSISKEWAKDFLLEVLQWDGSFGKLDSGGMYVSVIKENCDIIQAVACFCGYKSRYTYDERVKDENKKPIHKIFLSDGQYFGVEKLEPKEVRYDNYVYCVEVPSHKLIVRRGGHTLVCGNSTRRGAFASYLPIDHPDILEYLRIKEIGHPIQELNFAVTIKDSWMDDMIKGDKQKRKVWSKIIERRYNSGYPYVIFIDNANNNKPEVYKDMEILASNVCSEIFLPSTPKESFVCVLSSLNLLHYDKIKNTDAIECLIYLLDAVCEEFIIKGSKVKFMDHAVDFAKKHRALGLGALGWHSLLQSKRISFESMEAKMLNNEIFSLIQKKATKASKYLAKELGEPALLKGKGMRNTTVTAIAPTTSSSFILGQISPSIEPLNSNYFVKKLAKGNFTYKNPHLEDLLKEKGQNTEIIWKSILTKGGSVQHLDFLTKEEKDVFKTFGEISQKEIVIQAAQRQKYIDQGQSLNIMIPPKVKPKEVSDLLIEGWRLGVKGFYYQRSANPAQELSRSIMTCSSCEG